MAYRRKRRHREKGSENSAESAKKDMDGVPRHREGDLHMQKRGESFGIPPPPIPPPPVPSFQGDQELEWESIEKGWDSHKSKGEGAGQPIDSTENKGHKPSVPKRQQNMSGSFRKRRASECVESQRTELDLL